MGVILAQDGVRELQPNGSGKQDPATKQQVKEEMKDHWGKKAEGYDESKIPDKTTRENLAKDKDAWIKYFTNLAGIWAHIYKEDKRFANGQFAGGPGGAPIKAKKPTDFKTMLSLKE